MFYWRFFFASFFRWPSWLIFLISSVYYNHTYSFSRRQFNPGQWQGPKDEGPEDQR